jgi:hypothetical protein
MLDQTSWPARLSQGRRPRLGLAESPALKSCPAQLGEGSAAAKLPAQCSFRLRVR